MGDQGHWGWHNRQSQSGGPHDLKKCPVDTVGAFLSDTHYEQSWSSLSPWEWALTVKPASRAGMVYTWDIARRSDRHYIAHVCWTYKGLRPLHCLRVTP